MDPEDEAKDKKKAEKNKDASEKKFKEKGEKRKPKLKGSRTSEVKFSLPKNDANQENIDHSKPGTSKDESNTSENVQAEESQVDQWLENILKSTDELRNSQSSAMTLPGRGSQLSGLHYKRMTMHSGSTSKDSTAIRRKLSVLLPSHAVNRLQTTLNELEPRKSVERHPSRRNILRDRSSSKESHVSLLEQKRSRALQSLEGSISSAEIPIEEAMIHETDEELMDHLSAVRSLAMPLKEKRKIRNSIIAKIKQPKHLDSTFAQKQQKVKFFFRHLRKEFVSKTEIWSRTLKKVEGHFGTGVVSFFVFLRFLFFLNMVIFFIFTIFIVLPQSLGKSVNQKEVILAPNISIFDDSLDKYFKTLNFKTIEPLQPISKGSADEFFVDDIGVENLGSLLNTYLFPDVVNIALHYHHRSNHTSIERDNISRYCHAAYAAIVKNETKYSFISVIQDFLQGTGWMERTLLFIGFYHSVTVFGSPPYNMAIAFIFVLIAIFIISIIMMIKFTSEGNRESLLLGTEVVNYSNVLFGSWDYCITSKKTAKLKHSSIVREMKSLLSESHRKQKIKQWTSMYKAKVYSIRFLINLIISLLLFLSLYLIYMAAIFQMEKYRKRALAAGGFHVFLIQYLCPFTIMALYLIMSFLFPFLVTFEKYHAQTEINITIFRLLFLRLTSLIVLVSLIYYEIVCQPQNMCGLGISKECPSPICWETFVGQQMYKLVIIDLFAYLATLFFLDIPWDYAVKKWKNRYTAYVGRQIFDIPVHVLALLYSQTLAWLGMFYSPLLPFINMIKIVLIFYMKRHTVLKRCQPNPVAYKASRSNAIFMLLLFIIFFFILFVLCYAVTNLLPSPGCSPFGIYVSMSEAITEAREGHNTLTEFLHFIFNSVFYIPVSILLCLVIYYYITTRNGYKRMVNLLKTQLVLEGRDKEFLLNRIAEAATQSTST